MHIVYASFIRYPAEKAHALYVAKVCESFASFGHQVTLLVPSRHGTVDEDHKSFYILKHGFILLQLWCLDLLRIPFFKSFFHRIGLFTFSVSSYRCVRVMPTDTLLFTNDVWLALVLSFTKVRVIYEVHDYPTGQWWLYRYTAQRVHKIQTNNYQKVARVLNDMNVSKDKVYAVHNGVDIEEFDIAVSKESARAQLKLDLRKQYAVYTGHLYDWKGVPVLAEAAKFMPDIDVLIVGGTYEDIASMKIRYAGVINVHFLGHSPHHKIPLFLKAADVLVLPNSGCNDLSRFHTSPIKLFEYMASKRPIVASDLPTIREILQFNNAILVPPDNPKILAEAVLKACTHDVDNSRRVEQAYSDVLAYSWHNRAQRIFKYIS